MLSCSLRVFIMASSSVKGVLSKEKQWLPSYPILQSSFLYLSCLFILLTVQLIHPNSLWDFSLPIICTLSFLSISKHSYSLFRPKRSLPEPVSSPPLSLNTHFCKWYHWHHFELIQSGDRCRVWYFQVWTDPSSASPSCTKVHCIFPRFHSTASSRGQPRYHFSLSHSVAS